MKASRFESLRALAQASKHLEARIAVGRLEADLLLKCAHRALRLIADAAVDAGSIEAGRREPLLQFLQFRKRHGTLASREELHERTAAHDAVTEVRDGERVVHGRVVAADGVEVLPEQETRAALHRHPQLRRCAGPRKGLAIRA